MAKQGLWIGSLMGFLAVALGAFGAHGLEEMLADLDSAEAAEKIRVWNIAARYLMYHALITFLVGMLGQFNRHQALGWALYCFVGGSAIFSGALFILALTTNMNWLGMIAPIGGVALMAGWLLMVLVGYKAVTKKKKKPKKDADA